MNVELGTLIAIGGLLLNFAGYMAARATTLRKDGQESAKVSTELGYIRKGVDDIRIDLKANEKNITVLQERVTRVEESSKQAHKRIDEIAE